MTLQIETLVLGPLETNSYVLWSETPCDEESDTGGRVSPGGGANCWIVDVGMWSKPLVELLHERNLDPQRILLTHCHGDHIGGVEYVKGAFGGVRICCPATEKEMLKDPELNLSATFLMGIEAPDPDELLAPGEVLHMGPLAWEVLDTSGHTPGGLSFYCPEEGVVFCGDALFADSIGRTDIPRGDHERLIENIRRNLLSLPDETRVYPGHGPETTIGRERKSNPYLN